MRRSVFLALLALLIVFGIYRYQRLHAPNGPLRIPEKYTPATGAKIDLKDVQVLSALDAEYTNLIDKVVPSVVSVTSRRVGRVPVDPFEFLFRGRPNRGAEVSSLGSGVIVSKEGH